MSCYLSCSVRASLLLLRSILCRKDHRGKLRTANANPSFVPIYLYLLLLQSFTQLLLWKLGVFQDPRQKSCLQLLPTLFMSLKYLEACLPVLFTRKNAHTKQSNMKLLLSAVFVGVTNAARGYQYQDQVRCYSSLFVMQRLHRFSILILAPFSNLHYLLIKLVGSLLLLTRYLHHATRWINAARKLDPKVHIQPSGLICVVVTLHQLQYLSLLTNAKEMIVAARPDAGLAPVMDLMQGR